MLHRLYRLLVLFGIDPRKTLQSLRGLLPYFRDLKTLKSQRSAASVPMPFGAAYPCLGDRDVVSGTTGGHYFHQDLLVARRIHLNKPTRHVDVASRVDGFVAHVASFRSIEVLDIRPLPATIPNVTFRQADLMAPVGEDLWDCCDSLSCLHALEHFGLGRYGDQVDFDGYLVGLENLWKILKQGGKFYFSVPIGPQQIRFNSHRQFSLRFLVDRFAGKYRVDQFSYVNDQGELHENVSVSDSDAETSFGCVFGCGIFEMTKL